MTKINISKRLEQVASFIDKGSFIQDIGSDHGHLPIYLVQNEICEKAIASEVNQLPYLNAMGNIKKYGLEEKIKVILCDGIENLSREVDTLVFAGMGGGLAASILEKNSYKLENIRSIVAACQGGEERFRETLQKNGFKISKEKIIEENGKFYEIIKANKTKKEFKYAPHQLKFGPLLLLTRDELFLRKWQDEKNKLISILNQIQNKNLQPYKNVQKRIDFIEKWVA